MYTRLAALMNGRDNALIGAQRKAIDALLGLLKRLRAEKQQLDELIKFVSVYVFVSLPVSASVSVCLSVSVFVRAPVSAYVSVSVSVSVSAPASDMSTRAKAFGTNQEK